LSVYTKHTEETHKHATEMKFLIGIKRYILHGP